MIRIMLTYERSRAWGVKKCDIRRRFGCRAWYMLHYRALHRLWNAGTSTTNRHVLRSLLYALYNNSQLTYPVWCDGTTRTRPLCVLVSLFLYALLQHVIHILFGIGSFCIKIQGFFSFCYHGTKAGNRRFLLGSVPTRILVGTSPWSFQLLILASLLISRNIERTHFQVPAFHLVRRPDDGKGIMAPLSWMRHLHNTRKTIWAVFLPALSNLSGWHATGPVTFLSRA